MSVRSAQSITVEFNTARFDTGAATNADSLPAGTLVVNGTDNAASVTVTNVDAGRYKAAVTLPTLAVGDVVELSVAATVNSVAGKAIVWRDTKDIVIDSAGLADANTVKVGPTGSGTAQTARDLGQALPNAAPAAAGGLLISAAGIAGATLDTDLGRLDAAVTSRMATYTQPTGFLAATFPTTVPTAAQTATAVWQDATAGDFTTSGSIGKSLFTSGAVPGAAGGLQIAGSNAATTYNALTVTNATTLSGAVSLGSTLTVTGATTLTGLVTATNGISSDLSGNIQGYITGNVQGDIEGNIQGSVQGDVGAVFGNVGGKVLGGGAGVITGTGVRAVNQAGADIPSETTLTSAIAAAAVETDTDGLVLISPDSAQDIRDAMKLAPTGGAAESDSIDDKIDNSSGGSGDTNNITVEITDTQATAT